MTEASLAERSIERVRTWVSTPSRRQRDKADDAAARLAAQLRDPAALQFTVQFIDRVIRPDDADTAADALRELAAHLPDSLAGRDRRMLRFGATASQSAPEFVQRRARESLRRLVGHLLLDATPTALTASMAELTRSGDRLNISLLGESVLGETAAVQHLERLLTLIRRNDVDYVSVKVSSIASQLNEWAFGSSVDRVVERLLVLFAEARRANTFVNVDMEEYASTDLTLAAFTRALEHFPDLTAGIAIQAYLPDSAHALEQLQTWAAERRAAGGAPIKVRIVKGANLGMEQVQSELRGWPLPTWETKAQSDAHYKRLLRWALTPERIQNVHVGVAGQNLFDLAYAWNLAGDRQVRDGVEFEALLGLDGGPLRTARADLGPLRLYTPVVHPDDFDAALAYLVRRLQEAATPGNFLTSLPRLSEPGVFDQLASEFRESAEAASHDADVAPRRTQDRAHEVPHRTHGFTNTPDTDPALAANRAWAEVVASRSTYTTLGVDAVQMGKLLGPASLETMIASIREGATAWSARSPELRSWTLHQAGLTLAARRGDLIAVMMAETGKTFAEADTEVSEAVDFAHYYADELLRLDTADGARFQPSRLIVVAPPWNFPVAIPAGGVLAALASGSGVILKPAPQSPRCAAVLVEALWEAGIPRDVLALACVADGELSQHLVTHPDVDRAILTGSWDTARLFRTWRPDLPVLAETSGKNAIIVTPSADYDRAVADVVRSAFGNAGQKCSAASLAILVGSVSTSERFERQLVDAVTSLAVGRPDDLATSVGPLVEPARDPLLNGLTTLGSGESWLVEPRRMDEAGRLWTPGVRRGVAPGSEFHVTEYFGPVLGIMHASSLEEAVEWQNSTAFGLTAGLHSLDPSEVRTWVDAVEAGNLYVNRPITGAIVRRQPFGGWKKSSVGATAKAGGPNYLARLGSWHPAPLANRGEAAMSSHVSVVLNRCATVLDDPAISFLRAVAASDQRAWEAEFGRAEDPSGLQSERNVLRYRPTPVTIRAESTLVPVARVLLAACRAEAPVTISSAFPLPDGINHVVETSEAWCERVVQRRPARVRLVGAPLGPTVEAVAGDPAVTIYADEVTSASRVELLPFLREQSVSISTQRYGIVDHTVDPFA